jgi:hypothetical protein
MEQHNSNINDSNYTVSYNETVIDKKGIPKIQKDDSHLYGYEPLNDLRLPKINSQRKSTPETGRYLDADTPSMKPNISEIQTPIDSVMSRKINKRTKKSSNPISAVS